MDINIEEIKCLRTSLETKEDEIYIGGIFIPFNGDLYKEPENTAIEKDISCFATTIYSFGKEKKEVTLSGAEFKFEKPIYYDNYILILQLIEKDDGVIHHKFLNGEVKKAIENQKILANALKVLIENMNSDDFDSKDVWASLGKMVVKALPAVFMSIVGDTFKQIRMDDIIDTKQFHKEKILEFSESTDFKFSKMFAKYIVTVQFNNTKS